MKLAWSNLKWTASPFDITCGQTDHKVAVGSVRWGRFVLPGEHVTRETLSFDKAGGGGRKGPYTSRPEPVLSLAKLISTCHLFFAG